MATQGISYLQLEVAAVQDLLEAGDLYVVSEPLFAIGGDFSFLFPSRLPHLWPIAVTLDVG